MRSSTLSGRQVCLATISVGIPERPCLPAIAASLHSDCRVAPPVLPCPSAYIGMARFEKKCTRVHTLIRTDTRAIGSDQNEIRAFLTVRNEMLRLPWTLEHYRNIGVSRFFVIDNGSTDGSKEFLLAQPDCHVFTTRDSYAESMYGAEWQKALLNEYGINHWCLTVDADEWFIYPGYESQPLSALATHLERSGAQGVFAFLLDMYAAGTIAESISEKQVSPLDISRYFDRNYVWRRRFYIPRVQQPAFPEYDVTGGPRLRMLFPFLHRHYYLLEVMWQTSYCIYLVTKKTPLPVALRPPPTLPKIPFVRWLPGTRYQHPHATTPIKRRAYQILPAYQRGCEHYRARGPVRLRFSLICHPPSKIAVLRLPLRRAGATLPSDRLVV